MRMKNTVARRGLLAVLVLGLVVVLGVSPAIGATTTTAARAGTAATKPGSVPAYGAKLRTLIPEAMKANAIPGTVVLIRSPKQGNWSATFGTAELGKQVPMSLKDHFRIGSNTKTMTSTVILQLVGEGKLKLSDPIGKFVPGVPNGNRITIRELSEMRSGLFSYTFDPGFNATLDKNPNKGWTSAELLKIAFKHKPNFAPGKEYEYSNTNIVLLGVVIEKLTGMSASEALEERIFKPLGMTHTELPARTNWRLPEPHAEGYQFGSNVETIDSYAVPKAEQAAALDGSLKPLNDTDANPSWAWTAGGAISTPADLATYVKAMVGGGLLSPRMQKVRMNSIRPIVPGMKNGVGYGLGIAQFAPNILGHDGQLPGFSSFMAYDLKTGVTVIISANLSASPVTGENAAVELGKVVLGTLYGNAIVPKGDAAAPPAS
ncbi:MAG TPA: serine hydrolase domain-containing protein [Solirubrobacterales bacterium]|nr:serine hydrolase domain-containing protein [Solirubrobacterales bacterium]